MADSLAKYGLYIDDLSKIRVLDPEVVNQAVKLKDESQTFVTKITEFKKGTDEFIKILDNVGQRVDKEKMKVIGARNLLRSVAKEREERKQQMQALIMEKSIELERLRVQYDSLKKIEMEQLEIIEHLTVN
ncbi:intraflagellar transport protein 20 homolog [Leptopilina heterotoma]|uniref:intraflagellar transport protein 20 homolog n=1 Tax=Leptopilina heterotoma TaxID=63436 RepID=UPI001CA93A97|nr:intraflagellar transport protein 20 homolog [Leptopilina heterotoma]